MNDHPIRQLLDALATTPGGVQAMLIVLGAWLVVYPAGWLVAWLMGAKKQQLENPPASDNRVIAVAERGFADGGKIIGRLERLLIYLFVLSDALGAVGFLIAAKSIFRFGELSNQSNRLEAEYITIGTLMSFAVGLAIALGVRCLLV